MDGGANFKRDIVKKVIERIYDVDELLAKIERARRIICSNYLDGTGVCVGHQTEVSTTTHICHVCKKKWCRRCSHTYSDLCVTFCCGTCRIDDPVNTTYICVECNVKTSELQSQFGNLSFSLCSKHVRKGP